MQGMNHILNSNAALLRDHKMKITSHIYFKFHTKLLPINVHKHAELWIKRAKVKARQ